MVVGLPVDGPFDYAVAKDFRGRIAVGQRVRVSFNRRDRVGFVVGAGQRSAFKELKPVLSLLDAGPVLDRRAFELAGALRDYYGCSLGEAIETCLPAALRCVRFSAGPAALPVQGRADTAAGLKAEMILVHDQTRHKRWPFVIGYIQKILAGRRSVIFLVPEASFIGETAATLNQNLGCPVVVFERKLTPKKELAQWERIRGGGPAVIVGLRSAVFAPAPNLGLIVIDGEENGAYKQAQAPHYHVHEVAGMRAKIDRCAVMFVSSAPSAETWEKAKRGKWERMAFDADGEGKIQVIDMNNYNPGKTSILSFPLQNAIRKTLGDNGKIILFMNRLGFSTRTHCPQCGFTVKCERCNVHLTYLYSKKMMVCRHCRFKRPLPKTCPACEGPYLRSTGTGIEKLESETARLYPDARVQRYDSESTVFPKSADIVITTQAVFRRHDRRTVSLVAVLNFDAQMNRFDFRSGQKAFSLLVHLRQLAGERLMVQTRMTDNYCLKAAQAMDFDQFYRQELKLRRELGLPPYRHLVALGLRGAREESVFEQSKALFRHLEGHRPKGIEISDPHPDVTPKMRDKYRFTILLKGRSVKGILNFIKPALKGFRKRGVVITVNVDP